MSGLRNGKDEDCDGAKEDAEVLKARGVRFWGLIEYSDPPVCVR